MSIIFFTDLKKNIVHKGLSENEFSIHPWLQVRYVF